MFLHFDRKTPNSRGDRIIFQGDLGTQPTSKWRGTVATVHTAEDADRPHVIIRLGKACDVRYLKILNRRRSHQERAAGLTVWLSGDGRKWKSVWQAKSVRDEWLVDLGEGHRCSYVRVGLERRGTLHLYKVTVFGK